MLNLGCDSFADPRDLIYIAYTYAHDPGVPLPSGDYLVRLDSGSPYAMSARGVPLTIASPPVSRFITFQLEPANTATVHVVNGTGPASRVPA